MNETKMQRRTRESDLFLASLSEDQRGLLMCIMLDAASEDVTLWDGFANAIRDARSQKVEGT